MPVEQQMQRACLSLEGLSIGDAFGQQFFLPHVAAGANRDNPPTPPWNYTDDTEMTLALVETLHHHHAIHQDDFALRLASRYESQPYRGYGAGARRLLQEISAGGDWRALSRNMFSGLGSFGNGAAMRAAPLGAWFAGDVEKVIQQAILSAEVTHAHPEGQAGAIAVALAAAWAVEHRGGDANEMIPSVISHMDPSEVRRRLEWVATYPLDTWAYTIASQVGSGYDISAQDTVPFCLWMTAAHWADYKEAMWVAARVGGDIDTTCAIIGGLIALNVGREGIPADWFHFRERLNWKISVIEPSAVNRQD